MFGFGKNSILGVDIGSSIIKIVEMEMKGKRPVLKNYAWARIDKYLRNDEIFSSSSADVLAILTKEIFRRGKFKTKKSNISIPSFSGLITLIDMPESIRDGNFEEAIKYEAHKYVPTSLDEVVLSWDTVGGDESSKKRKEEKVGGGKIQVLLVAASKMKVARYEEIIKESELDLNSIEIESFSMARSLVGNDPGRFVIVDIGSHLCNIIFVENGLVKVNRNIDAGGQDVTRTISKSLDIDEVKAEKMKVSGENFFTQKYSLMFPTLELITKEISRVIESYQKKSGLATSVDGIILSGGSAGMAGLEEYFQRYLSIPTSVGNPFSRVEYDKKLDPVVAKIKNQFSVAIGLALKGQED